MVSIENMTTKIEATLIAKFDKKNKSIARRHDAKKVLRVIVTAINQSMPKKPRHA